VASCWSLIVTLAVSGAAFGMLTFGARKRYVHPHPAALSEKVTRCSKDLGLRETASACLA